MQDAGRQIKAATAVDGGECGEFAVRSRQVAIGGQLLELQGLGGVYPDVFLPLHGAHQAANASLALAALLRPLGIVGAALASMVGYTTTVVVLLVRLRRAAGLLDGGRLARQSDRHGRRRLGILRMR